MKKIILAVVLLTANASASAATIGQCIGMNASGRTVKVLIDIRTDKMFVNGDLFRIEQYRSSRDGVYSYAHTYNFYNKSHDYVYDTVIVGPGGDAAIVQQKVYTGEIIASVDLSCVKED